MVQISCLYDITDAIRDGLDVGDRYTDEFSQAQVMDDDTWTEWAPLDVQVRKINPAVAVYF